MITVRQVFDMIPSRVRVVSRQTYLFMGQVTSRKLDLNSHDIDVKSVHMFTTHSLLGKPPCGLDAKVPDFVAHVASLAGPVALDFEVNTDERKLIISLPQAISFGEEISFQIVSECHPNDRTLEGIYFDYTPTGCPQTMITQCQREFLSLNFHLSSYGLVSGLPL
jgi:hypothetical protein